MEIWHKFKAASLSSSIGALVTRRRNARLAVAILISSTILTSLWYFHDAYDGQLWRIFGSRPIEVTGRPPPVYKDIFEYEDALPQHNKSLRYPEGEHGVYFYPANHIWGLGLNNVLQELVLLAYLAYASNRALVFDPYTWHWDDSQDYSSDNGHYSDNVGEVVPSRLPLNAFLSGPIAGGPFEVFDRVVPRAVNRKYFQDVCPHPEIIDSQEVNKAFGDQQVGVDIMVEKWVQRLDDADRCVEMKRGSDQIFNFYVFGHPRVLTIWPALSNSPILKQWGWSSMVYSAIQTNSDLLMPRKNLLDHLSSVFSPDKDDLDPLSPIPGLLAIHVRRGDFDKHCDHLTKWSGGFNGFNQFEGLPDRFEVPPGGGWGENTEENYRFYDLHCYPTIEQIAEKVGRVRDDAMVIAGITANMTVNDSTLRKLFIMTNGNHDWVEELKSALKNMGTWETVVASNDLVLSWDQKYISQAIDMAIGQRAEYFIGNGFSSMTSNLVMLRMAREMPPHSTRFW